MKSLLTPNPSLLRKEGGSKDRNKGLNPLFAAERVDQRSEVGVSQIDNLKNQINNNKIIT